MDEPVCEWCGENRAVKRLATAGGARVCLDCYQDWLHGRYDQDPPDDGEGRQ